MEHKSSCELYFYSLQLFFCRFDVWKKGKIQMGGYQNEKNELERIDD